MTAELSPDLIAKRSRLTTAGKLAAEVTGRSTVLEYGEEGAAPVVRGRAATGGRLALQNEQRVDP